MKTETDADVTKTFLESVAVTHDQISKIEEASRGQSESEVWIKQRKGRITASMCHMICTKVKSIVRNPSKKKKKNNKKHHHLYLKLCMVDNL